MSKVAKRLECAGFSGAVGRAERLEWRIFPVRTKSGAEVTAVQTLREFRSVAAFGRKPPSENGGGEECGALPRRRYVGHAEMSRQNPMKTEAKGEGGLAAPTCHAEVGRRRK